MSCLDVMYQVFGPQPYFSSYSPYHHQKLALYTKMQDPQDSRLGPPAIKEEDKELPPGAEYLSSRCVLFTYFQGDISAVVDEHFSRALSHAPAYPASSSHKASSRSPGTRGAIGSQGSAYPRPGVHEMYSTAFDPRYGSLLVPSVRNHHRMTSGSSVPSASPCDLGGKGESGTSSWSGAFTGAGAEIGLNMDTGLQAQDKSKDLYWF
ncbi:hypothetical protein KUCAC02_009581 [Chaenocephalus aceratus]|nr:hypothetical protein KUCAC02_009581 [Chaenocephalus aceratus]